MNTNKSKTEIVAAFNTAAKELGFTFTSPFHIGGHSYLGLVHDFGNAKGTVIFLLGSTNNFTEVKAAGYFCSELNAELYCTFDHKLFQETLNDWGYFGPFFKTPSWYTGNPWG